MPRSVCLIFTVPKLPRQSPSLVKTSERTAALKMAHAETSRGTLSLREIEKRRTRSEMETCSLELDAGSQY